MSSHFDQEARWISTYAANLAKVYGCSYSLLVYRGQDAYRRGDSVDQIRDEMRDYCHTKSGRKVVRNHIQSSGTG